MSTDEALLDGNEEPWSSEDGLGGVRALVRIASVGG